MDVLRVVGSRLVGDDHLDLDACVPRQLGDTNGRSRVPAGVAEHLDQKVGCGIDDLWLRIEARRRGNEADDLQHTFDPVERSKRLAETREALQHANPRFARATSSDTPAPTFL